MIWRLVLLPEGDAPIQKQPQTGLHGMGAGFHDHELPLGNGLQFVRCHERPLHHLQRLAGFAFSFADRAALYGLAAQRFGQHFRCLALRREATKNRAG